MAPAMLLPYRFVLLICNIGNVFVENCQFILAIVVRVVAGKVVRSDKVVDAEP